jgi:membrane-associated PAP2 superfamily phosphatase
MNPSRRNTSHFLWTLTTLGLLLAWDASGLDMPMARLFGDSNGFAGQYHWVLAGVLHDGARLAAWVPAVWIVAGVWWPSGILAKLGRSERAQWAVTTVVALIAISVLKQASRTSCPWDLVEFGRHAAWVSHWDFHLGDGGGGHCFPAGHASAGFAFLGGYFALRRTLPGPARAWLIGSMAVGFLLGASQQMRGAHFMSHTLWTAWLCWTTAWLIDATAQRIKSSRGPALPVTPALPVARAPAN